MAAAPDAGVNLDDPAGVTRTAEADETIYEAGDAGAELYIVREGRVQLSTTGGSSVVVEAGGLFGEEVFADTPREFTARALSPVSLVRLDRPTFDRICTEAPQVPMLVVRQLSRRLLEQARTLPPAPRAAAAPVPVAERGAPVLVDASSGTEFSLADLTEATVGRPDRASGFVPEVDLTKLDTDRTLSRRHARLVRTGTAWVVREETGTRNGTFVNGTRVTTGDEIELHDGDTVQFGFVRMVFRWR
jgi:CRP-like cAMP-binding protein